MPVDEATTEEAGEQTSHSRRSILKLGTSAALGLGAYAMAACSSSSPGTTGQAANENSVLDKWLSTKTRPPS